METESFVTRLAIRFRLPIALVGTAAILLASANLFFQTVDDQLVRYAAIAIGCVTAAFFLSSVFDPRFQRAIAALNSQRRAEAGRVGGPARLGVGLPSGDTLLTSVSVPLLVLALLAANYYHRFPAAALLFGAFALCVLAQIGLMVRGLPTNR